MLTSSNLEFWRYLYSEHRLCHVNVAFMLVYAPFESVCPSYTYCIHLSPALVTE